MPTLEQMAAQGSSMPPELQQVLFGLKKNEPTMVETAQGFIVAVAVEIIVPDPKDDEAAFNKMRLELSRNIGNDFTTVFQDAVRLRANPQINQANFNQIVHP